MRLRAGHNAAQAGDAEHGVGRSGRRGDDPVSRGQGGRPTGFDKRAYVFHGTVTVAAIRLWLRSQPARPVSGPGPPVDELTHDIEVAVVAGRLLNEVEDHPPEVYLAAVADGTLGR